MNDLWLEGWSRAVVVLDETRGPERRQMDAESFEASTPQSFFGRRTSISTFADGYVAAWLAAYGVDARVERRA